MSTDLEGSVTQFFHQMCVGNQEALRTLWGRFFPRLLGLARKTLSYRPERFPDAEDAVQSAFVSLWKGAEAGKFVALDRDDLWNLLAVITVRKVRRRLARDMALKRGGGKVLNEADLRDNEFRLEDELAQIPTQELDLECEEMLLQLDEELRTIAVTRMMGYTNSEIAEILECTERTVEWKLQRIRTIWQSLT